jgi:hypothetical protein
MRTASLIALLLIAVFGQGSACQRSPEFKKDQTYYQSDVPSYYNKGGAAATKTPSARIEAMGQPKKRILVLDFWNDTPIKLTDLGVFAADELRRNLHLTQRVILPTDLKSDRVTEDFINGDNIKVAQLIREGRKLGVAVLVVGRVTKVIFRQRGDEVGLFRQKQSLAAVDVEIKVFDIMNGKEVSATAKSGEASSNTMVALEQNNLESPEYRAELTRLAIRNAVSMLVPDVIHSLEKLAWEGNIAKIQGKKVFLNAGRTAGLVPGDILKVMTQGEDVYDPSTGAYLGRAPGQLKGTLEVVDFLGGDAAVAEVHTGGNIQEGDIVQLY